MDLKKIYQSITDDLKEMECLLSSAITESSNHSILEMSKSLLESPGKRARPALVILCAKAATVGVDSDYDHDELICVAAAMELIHMASLIHDDVVDGASMRHNMPSINARWGDGVSLLLGDYIYSKAFEMIGKCRNPDVFVCLSEAMHVMCEGELSQIFQRNNL